jgi:hypothetical protein
MRPRPLIFAALLGAVPASGGGVTPTPAQVDALTAIDTPPTRAVVDLAFASDPGPSPGLEALQALAVDPMQDLGLQIRAIRALPQYCPPAGCPAGTAAHDALAMIIDDYQTPLTTAALAPQDVLRLRVAIEALGATRSGLQVDVDRLTATALLQYPSRDVQVTAVQALHSLCSPDLCSPGACQQAADAVRALPTVADTQVADAVSRALPDLARCAQP